jgi:signal peptidase
MTTVNQFVGTPPARSPKPLHAGQRAGQRAGMRAGMRPLRLLAGLGRALVSTVLVLTTGAFVFLGVGPHVFGYRTSTMLTGSMSPGINPGDVVVTVPQPAKDIAVGDVISYHIPLEDHRVETHRVIEVTRDPAGRLAVVTKGDANTDKDPWVATLEGDTVYEVKAVIPHLGSAIRALRTPAVQGFALWGSLGAMVVIGLLTIWRKDPENGAGTSAPGEGPRA